MQLQCSSLQEIGTGGDGAFKKNNAINWTILVKIYVLFIDYILTSTYTHNSVNITSWPCDDEALTLLMWCLRSNGEGSEGQDYENKKY